MLSARFPILSFAIYIFVIPLDVLVNILYFTKSNRDFCIIPTIKTGAWCFFLFWWLWFYRGFSRIKSSIEKNVIHTKKESSQFRMFLVSVVEKCFFKWEIIHKSPTQSPVTFQCPFFLYARESKKKSRVFFCYVETNRFFVLFSPLSKANLQYYLFLELFMTHFLLCSFFEIYFSIVPF